MIRDLLSALLIAGLAVPALAGDQKAKKPKLELRATPRFAFSPASIFFTAELTGGDDVEELHCPELEWQWDDGGKSVHESDCAPFEEGKTEIERRFTANHEFKAAGTYNVKLTMRKADRRLAETTVRVTVRAGFGDSTIED
jgi:plastocyanin